eukprot:2902583-Prymnesium_polylepis.1
MAAGVTFAVGTSAGVTLLISTASSICESVSLGTEARCAGSFPCIAQLSCSGPARSSAWHLTGW